MPTADIFCGHAKVPVPWDEVVRGGRLRWIQSSAAGLDHCLVPSVIASDIIVTSASGVLADQVAEHTIALVTALTRSLPVFFRAQQQREFIHEEPMVVHDHDADWCPPENSEHGPWPPQSAKKASPG